MQSAGRLFDFATHEDYRTAVKKEFEGLKALFGEYQEALKNVYVLPKSGGSEVGRGQESNPHSIKPRNGSMSLQIRGRLAVSW